MDILTFPLPSLCVINHVYFHHHGARLYAEWHKCRSIRYVTQLTNGPRARANYHPSPKRSQNYHFDYRRKWSKNAHLLLLIPAYTLAVAAAACWLYLYFQLNDKEREKNKNVSVIRLAFVFEIHRRSLNIVCKWKYVEPHRRTLFLANRRQHLNKHWPRVEFFWLVNPPNPLERMSFAYHRRRSSSMRSESSATMNSATCVSPSYHSRSDSRVIALALIHRAARLTCLSEFLCRSCSWLRIALRHFGINFNASFYNRIIKAYKFLSSPFSSSHKLTIEAKQQSKARRKVSVLLARRRTANYFKTKEKLNRRSSERKSQKLRHFTSVSFIDHHTKTEKMCVHIYTTEMYSDQESVDGAERS